MYILCVKTFPQVPKFLSSDLDLEVWPTFKKTFYLGHNFLTRRGSFYLVTLTLKFDLLSN